VRPQLLTPGRRPWHTLLASLGLLVPLALLVGGISPANAAANPGLFVKYRTQTTCAVYLNMPGGDVLGNSHPFTVPAGRTLIWRYNVDATWAVVSYPTRAHKQFPWWGFTRRSCIGTSVRQSDYPAGVAIPNTIRQGRSNVTASHWRPVVFSVPAAPIQHRKVRMGRDATLRDPANFVIGNVPAGWHVDVTGVTRSNGHWVEVYVPNAKRWGYVQRTALS